MVFSDCILFAFSMFITALVLVLLLYFVITLSDLECDYLNTEGCCSRLNQWVLPKIIAHLFLSFLLLSHGHWILMLMNLPMASWMVFEFVTLPRGNLGVYDPTEMFNSGRFKKHMKKCWIYLGYFLILFCIYFYCFIESLIKEHPVNKQSEDEIISEF